MTLIWKTTNAYFGVLRASIGLFYLDALSL